MKIKTLAIPVLTLALVSPAGFLAAKAYAQPAPAFAQDRPWDQPPDEYRDVQRRGFHDGMDAARHDMDEHKHRHADDHEMFKHPPVPRDDRDAYRNAFREGYDRAMHHMMDHHD